MQKPTREVQICKEQCSIYARKSSKQLSILELVDESEGTLTERGSRMYLSIFLSFSDRD
jgi:hypothetical protein